MEQNTKLCPFYRLLWRVCCHSVKIYDQSFNFDRPEKKKKTFEKRMAKGENANKKKFLHIVLYLTKYFPHLNYIEIIVCQFFQIRQAYILCIWWYWY